MKRSSWLLSSDALPHVEIPVSPMRSLPHFRLPSCIGRSARAVPPPPPGNKRNARPGTDGNASSRFRDRTLAWFNIGEQMEREAEAELLQATLAAANEPRRSSPLRRAVLFAAAGAAFGIGVSMLVF
jgi:hypothetical protein